MIRYRVHTSSLNVSREPIICHAELLHMDVSQNVTLNPTFWLLIAITIEDGMVSKVACS